MRPSALRRALSASLRAITTAETKTAAPRGGGAPPPGAMCLGRRTAHRIAQGPKAPDIRDDTQGGGGAPPLRHARTEGGGTAGRIFCQAAGKARNPELKVRRPQGGGRGRRGSDQPREEVGPLRYRVKARTLRKKGRRHQGGGTVPPLLLRTPPGGGRSVPQETYLPYAASIEICAIIERWMPRSESSRSVRAFSSR